MIPMEMKEEEDEGRSWSSCGGGDEEGVGGGEGFDEVKNEVKKD